MEAFCAIRDCFQANPVPGKGLLHKRKDNLQSYGRDESAACHLPSEQQLSWLFCDTRCYPLLCPEYFLSFANTVVLEILDNDFAFAYLKGAVVIHLIQ